MAKDQEPEELTSKHVEAFHVALLELLDQLEQSLKEATLGSRPVTLDQQSVGRVSRIDAIQQQNMSAASRRSVERRIGQTKAALDAIENGRYGECRSCEEQIGYRRLCARPESPLCLICQSAREGSQLP